MAQAKTKKTGKKKSTARTRFYVVDTVQRTRRRVSDKLEDYNDTYITRPIQSGRDWVADLKADTRSLLAGIGKDAQLVVDEVLTGGRRVLDKVPGKRTIEKAVRLRVRRLPARLNLPSKKDIDGLARRVGTLNKKVDALHRAVAA
jgi:hypothetical protein